MINFMATRHSTTPSPQTHTAPQENAQNASPDDVSFWQDLQQAHGEDWRRIGALRSLIHSDGRAQRNDQLCHQEAPQPINELTVAIEHTPANTRGVAYTSKSGAAWERRSAGPV